jgi:hypothetical protein
MPLKIVIEGSESGLLFCPLPPVHANTTLLRRLATPAAIVGRVRELGVRK